MKIAILIASSLLFSAAALANNETTRQWFETINAGYPPIVGERGVYHANELATRYENNNYATFWFTAGKPSDQALALLNAINSSAEEGLNPKDYHQVALNAWFKNTKEANLSSANIADIDILLSDAFILLAQHLLLGKVDQSQLILDGKTPAKAFNTDKLWQQLLNGDSTSDILNNLKPKQIRYQRLKDALKNIKLKTSLAWPPLPLTPAIKAGVEDQRIAAIRQRLLFWQDLPTTENKDSYLFDAELVKAIERFQYRHGLTADGIIGEATLKALNKTPQERIDSIRINLERWRWLSENFGNQFIVVNIANFDLRFYVDNKVIFQKPVIVGRNQRKSPIFSDNIRHIVFNPTWTVPHKLAVQDKLPEIQKDPTYLNRLGFSLYDIGTHNLVEPKNVNWKQLGRNYFPYRLVQAPGPLNALGQVKFMFPNTFDVYLHDTPSRDLFSKTERAFSSGCIRVAQPLELAAVLLAQQGWSLEKINQVIASKETTTVILKQPMPIHIEYWTAWVDQKGTLNFRPDIYNRDPAIIHALNTEARQ